MNNNQSKSTIDKILTQLDGCQSSRSKNDLLLKLIEESKMPIHEKFMDPLCTTLRLLFVDREQAIRSQSFRAMRYVIKDARMLQIASKYNIDLFITLSLGRESKFLWERMQALKLVRHIMVVDASMLSRSIVQTLVSIAEHPKDDFRRVCLDAIRELVLINSAIVASCNGIKTIVNSIFDPTCQDITGSMTLTLLFLLDQDSTRCYLRPSHDIAKLLSVFSDTDSPNNREKEERRAAAHKALVTIMRSWTGILCLSSDNNGLRSLIQLLGLPSSVKGASWTREAIFDLLFEIMHVVRSGDLRHGRDWNVWARLGPNLLHSYIVIVLYAFIDCGLIQILTNLGMSNDKEFSGVATNLLTEILRLSSDLLPRSVCAKLNALPSVVMKASSFGSDVSSRVRAINMVNGLSTGKMFDAVKVTGSKKTGKLGNQESSFSPYNTRRSPDSRSDSEQRAIAHGINVERISIKADVEPYDVFENSNNKSIYGTSPEIKKQRSIGIPSWGKDSGFDDSELQAMLKKSHVTLGKNYLDWDFNICLQLLTGPLLNAQMLARSIQTTKFVKRLLSFFKPSKNIFSTLPWTIPNMVFVRVACQLFKVLLSQSEGREYVYFTELIEEIIHMILIEGPSRNMPTFSHKLSKDSGSDDDMPVPKPLRRRKTTSKKTTLKLQSSVLSRSSSNRLVREYFTLLGILSGSQFGLQILEKNEFFVHIEGLCLDRSQDYICRLIITNLDYTQGDVIGGSRGPVGARALLGKWLEMGSLDLRKYIVSQLRLFLRKDILHKVLYRWIIGLLVSQLTESGDHKLSLDAFSVLEEACQNPICLRDLISRTPDLSGFGDVADRLKLMMMSTREGVEYLNSIKWIEPQLTFWRSGGGIQKYVRTLENALVTALNSGCETTAPSQKDDHVESHAVSNDALLPKHTPGQQPWSGSAVVRSDLGDYLFDRIHRLPWTIKVTVSNAKTPQKVTTLLTDAFVRTSYATEAEGGGVALFVIGVLLATQGQIPKPYRLTHKTASIRARLSIGDGRDRNDGGLSFSSQKAPPDHSFKESKTKRDLKINKSGENGTQIRSREFQDYSSHYFSQKSEDSDKVLTMEDRKGLCKATPIIALDDVRWYFRCFPGGGHGRADAVELQSVWFRLPMPGIPMVIVSPAPHFYGQLAKTKNGCRRLRTSGHFTEFVSIIKSQSSSIQKRAALWALGQIGSSELGFELLKKTNIIQYISDQAHNCHTLSMRGTYLYILGLLSRTQSARAFLKKLSWQMPSNYQIGIVIPPMSKNFEAMDGSFDYLRVSQKRDNDGFLSIPKTKYVGSWAADPKNKFGVARVPSKDKAKEENMMQKTDPLSCAQKILGHISNLCNHVTQKSSLRALREMRNDDLYKKFFASTKMLFETLKLLTCYTYKLSARRFILYDLFINVKFNKDNINRFDSLFEGDADSSLTAYLGSSPSTDHKDEEDNQEGVYKPKKPPRRAKSMLDQ